MKIVVVGIGGVGTWLVDALVPFCNFNSKTKTELCFVDGDKFEEKNRERQSFEVVDVNKAESKAKELAEKFGRVIITPVPEYINADNIEKIIRNGDITFCCVDNHATRKIINEHYKKLKDGILISGGNELTDGNVQVYIRENGIDSTPPLDMYHPEIANPVDKHPDELSCQELLESEPQIVFMNMTISSNMLNAFYARVVHKKLEWNEVYLDLMKGGRWINREVLNEKEEVQSAI